MGRITHSWKPCEIKHHMECCWRKKLWGCCSFAWCFNKEESHRYLKERVYWLLNNGANFNQLITDRRCHKKLFVLYPWGVQGQPGQIWITWSSGSCPYTWQGVGIRWSFRFLPTQTILCHVGHIPFTSRCRRNSVYTTDAGQCTHTPKGILPGSGRLLVSFTGLYLLYQRLFYVLIE